MSFRRNVLVQIVVVGAIVLAACGTESSSTTADPPATPATVEASSAAGGDAGADGEGAAEATSCPVGYEEFDGNYPLRICHKGQTVTVLQELLVGLGYNIEVDGFFGEATQTALADAFGDDVGEITVPADMEALQTCDDDC